MAETKVLIIGGGASGLTAAGALKNAGIESIILDRDARTGEIWRKRYERLRLHTIRPLSYLAYHRISGDFPLYVPKEHYADYLEDYAKHFNLDIRHNCSVKSIRKGSPAWEVETADGELWQAQHVIIATGINHVPFIPRWQGTETYTGEFIHAVKYKAGKDYVGKRILVVGCGNTGAELCADLVEQGAKFVANSVRTAPMIVPRDPFGVPIHAWGIPMSFLPQKVGDALADFITYLHFGDLTKYGMKKRAWQTFKNKRIPMIDVGYVDYLKQGQIHIRPDIDHFTATGVAFQGHPEEAFDTVIAATGYRTGLEQFLQVDGIFDADGHVTVASGEPNQHKGLWFIGFTDSPAGILMSARIQSRKIAKYISASLVPSS